MLLFLATEIKNSKEVMEDFIHFSLVQGWGNFTMKTMTLEHSRLSPILMLLYIFIPELFYFTLSPFNNMHARADDH